MSVKPEYVSKFLGLVLSSALIGIGIHFINSNNSYSARAMVPIFIGAGILGAFKILDILDIAPFIQNQAQEEELISIRKDREEIRENLAKKQDKDVLDTIQLSLNQLLEYYTINTSQAKNSFRFSVFAIVIGLFVLVIGIGIFYFRENPNIQLATISGLSGIFLQFIGGANFYIYNRSLNQLNYFYAQLIRTQETMLSIKLCDQLFDKNQKTQVIEKLIMNLIERSSNVPILPEAGKPASKNRQPSSPAKEVSQDEELSDSE